MTGDTAESFFLVFQIFFILGPPIFSGLLSLYRNHLHTWLICVALSSPFYAEVLFVKNRHMPM